jgi:hypothetical protein
MSIDISTITASVDISTEIEDCDGSTVGGSVRFVAYTDSDLAINNVRAALAAVIGADADHLALTVEFDGPCPIVRIGFAHLDDVATFFSDGGTWSRHGLRLVDILTERAVKGVYRVVEGSGGDGVYSDDETAIGVSGDCWDVVVYDANATRGGNPHEEDTDEPGGWVSEGGWFFSDPA